MRAEAIQAARKYWCLGDAPITLVAERENRVYRVAVPGQPLALRVHRTGYRNFAEIESELLWMGMLASNGIPVPTPIPTVDNAFLKTFSGCTVSVLSWLDGEPLSSLKITTDMYFELGRKLSRMHALHEGWNIPNGFSRPTWNLLGEHPTWDRFWENPLLSAAQANFFLSFRLAAIDRLKAFEPLDVGLIHADLIPDNVLYNGSELQLIDFDDGGYGYLLFDLATITASSRRLHTNDELAKAAIDGYCIDREVDREALRWFEALRACTYVGWNISRMDEPNARERNGRYIVEAEKAIESVYTP